MSEPFAAQDALLFFEKSPAAFALYEGFAQKLLAAFPDTRVRVQKTQITFSNRHGFGCVSQLRVRKKAELPDPYIVVTLGLPAPLDSPRRPSRIRAGGRFISCSARRARSTTSCSAGCVRRMNLLNGNRKHAERSLNAALRVSVKEGHSLCWFLRLTAMHMPARIRITPSTIMPVQRMVIGSLGWLGMLTGEVMRLPASSYHAVWLGTISNPRPKL